MTYMPTYNDLGIILNSYEYGEADKILHIYTQKNGFHSNRPRRPQAVARR